MAEKFYKNDYKFQKDLRDFANNNLVGRILKPFLKGIYHKINPYLPYPRDFLIRQMVSDSICGEIGVYSGIFAERIVRIGKPKRLYLIDPWQGLVDRAEKKYSQEAQDVRYYGVIEKFSKQIKDGQVIVVRKTSDDAANDFADNFFDFLYVDGDHSYGQVVADLQNYHSKVKKGGILCGDDYHLDGVKKAVDEFVAKHSLKLEVKNRQFIIHI